MVMNVALPHGTENTKDTDPISAFPLKCRADTSSNACSILTEKSSESRNTDDVVIEARSKCNSDQIRDIVDDDCSNETLSLKTSATSSSDIFSASDLNLRDPNLSHGIDVDSGNSLLRYVIDTVEIGAETIIQTVCAPSDERYDTDEARSANDVATTKKLAPYEAATKESHMPTQAVATSHNQGPALHEENTSEGCEAQSKTALCWIDPREYTGGIEIQPDQWCGITHSIMRSTCNDLSDSVNIRSEILKNLGGGSSLNPDSGDLNHRNLTINTPSPSIVSPRVQVLLKEIETLGTSHFSEEAAQTLFTDKLVTVKQHLIEINDLLGTSPNNDKTEYVRIALRSAILNAEVETQRAELELKKIQLENMEVENQIANNIEDGPTVNKIENGSNSMLMQVRNKLLFKWKKSKPQP